MCPQQHRIAAAATGCDTSGCDTPASGVHSHAPGEAMGFGGPLIIPFSVSSSAGRSITGGSPAPPYACASDGGGVGPRDAPLPGAFDASALTTAGAQQLRQLQAAAGAGPDLIAAAQRGDVRLAPAGAGTPRGGGSAAVGGACIQKAPACPGSACPTRGAGILSFEPGSVDLSGGHLQLYAATAHPHQPHHGLAQGWAEGESEGVAPMAPLPRATGGAARLGEAPPAGAGSGEAGQRAAPALAVELGVSMASLERLFRADGAAGCDQPVWMAVNLQ
ncbi:hypothetical protein MNEG_13550, partial [Monoraphidium neglectum]